LILIGKTERTLLALIGSRREGALPAFIFIGYSTLNEMQMHMRELQTTLLICNSKLNNRINKQGRNRKERKNRVVADTLFGLDVAISVVVFPLFL